MNIFYLHSDPRTAAQMHCSKHVIKQILESGQLLSTAHRLLDGKEYIGKSKSGRKAKRWHMDVPVLEDFLYLASHVNHPSGVWARSGLKQYTWLAQLNLELCREYTFRYGKIHKIERTGLAQWLLDNPPKNIKYVEWTEPPQAMPDYCKVPGDSVTAYRKYYLNEKQRMLNWTGKVNPREIPHWAEEHIMKEANETV